MDANMLCRLVGSGKLEPNKETLAKVNQDSKIYILLKAMKQITPALECLRSRFLTVNIS